MKSKQGFTLIELLVVMAIFGILAAVGVSNYPEYAAGAIRANARQQLEFDIRRTRASASSEGAIAVFEIGGGGDSYTVGLDFVPFSSPPSPDQVLFTRELDPSITIGASETIFFDSRGYLIDVNGSLTTVDMTLSHNGTGYVDATVFPIGTLEYY